LIAKDFGHKELLNKDNKRKQKNLNVSKKKKRREEKWIRMKKYIKIN
jgi:hypothetical protein